jgi:hypothetical protein
MRSTGKPLSGACYVHTAAAVTREGFADGRTRREQAVSMEPPISILGADAGRSQQASFAADVPCLRGSAGGAARDGDDEVGVHTQGAHVLSSVCNAATRDLQQPSALCDCIGADDAAPVAAAELGRKTGMAHKVRCTNLPQRPSRGHGRLFAKEVKLQGHKKLAVTAPQHGASSYCHSQAKSAVTHDPSLSQDADVSRYTCAITVDSDADDEPACLLQNVYVSGLELEPDGRQMMDLMSPVSVQCRSMVAVERSPFPFKASMATAACLSSPLSIASLCNTSPIRACSINEGSRAMLPDIDAHSVLVGDTVMQPVDAELCLNPSGSNGSANDQQASHAHASGSRALHSDADAALPSSEQNDLQESTSLQHPPLELCKPGSCAGGMSPCRSTRFTHNFLHNIVQSPTAAPELDAVQLPAWSPPPFEDVDDGNDMAQVHDIAWLEGEEVQQLFSPTTSRVIDLAVPIRGAMQGTPPEASNGKAMKRPLTTPGSGQPPRLAAPERNVPATFLDHAYCTYPGTCGALRSLLMPMQPPCNCQAQRIADASLGCASPGRVGEAGDAQMSAHVCISHAPNGTSTGHCRGVPRAAHLRILSPDHEALPRLESNACKAALVMPMTSTSSAKAENGVDVASPYFTGSPVTFLACCKEAATVARQSRRRIYASQPLQSSSTVNVETSALLSAVEIEQNISASLECQEQVQHGRELRTPVASTITESLGILSITPTKPRMLDVVDAYSTVIDGCGSVLLEHVVLDRCFGESGPVMNGKGTPCGTSNAARVLEGAHKHLSPIGTLSSSCHREGNADIVDLTGIS